MSSHVLSVKMLKITFSLSSLCDIYISYILIYTWYIYIICTYVLTGFVGQNSQDNLLTKPKTKKKEPNSPPCRKRKKTSGLGFSSQIK